MDHGSMDIFYLPVDRFHPMRDEEVIRFGERPAAEEAAVGG